MSLARFDGMAAHSGRKRAQHSTEEVDRLFERGHRARGCARHAPLWQGVNSKLCINGNHWA